MDSKIELLFPRDVYGRIALAIASLSFGPVCWLMAIDLLFGSLPDGPLEWLFLAAVEQVIVTLGLYFACGLVWALAKPRWLERLLERVTKKVTVVALGLLCVLFLAPFAITFLTR